MVKILSEMADSPSLLGERARSGGCRQRMTCPKKIPEESGQSMLWIALAPPLMPPSFQWKSIPGSNADRGHSLPKLDRSAW